MDEKVPNELLIVAAEDGEVIFRVSSQVEGSRLLDNEAIVATITKVLYLFSRKVIKEQINFIRFQNHRMIFTYSEKSKLFAIRLVPKSMHARDFVPAMKYFLNVVEKRYLDNTISDIKKSNLANYYRILSAKPDEVCYITINTASSLLKLFVLIAGLVYDFGWPIETIFDNIIFIRDEGVNIEFESDSIFRYAFSIGIDANFDHDIVKAKIGTESDQNLLPSSGQPQDFTNTAMLFGENTSAMKFVELIDNDVVEVVNNLAKLPLNYGSDTIKAAFIAGISDPTNIIVNMTEPLIEKLAELEKKGERVAPVEQQEVSLAETETTSVLEPQETPFEAKQVTELDNEETDSILRAMSTAFEKATQAEREQASASPSQDTVQQEEIPIESGTGVSVEVETSENLKVAVETAETNAEAAELEDTSVGAFELPEITSEQPVISRAVLTLSNIPITINTSSYLSGFSDLHKLTLENIGLELLAPQNGFVHVLVNVRESNRIQEYINSISDITNEIDAEVNHSDTTVIIKIEEKTIYTYFRALIWSCIVEYLNQVAEGLIPKEDSQDLVEIPNDGSVMLIPPDRKYVKEKLPKQIIDIIEEDKLIGELETESIHTTPIVINTLLKSVFEPLKAGSGIAIIPRKNSQELSEITLALILISEITGVAFSRW